MKKSTVRIELQCTKCGHSKFSLPNDAADDPIFVCVNCGNLVGPKSSFDAIRLGEAHTHMRLNVVVDSD